MREIEMKFKEILDQVSVRERVGNRKLARQTNKVIVAILQMKAIVKSKGV